MTNPTLKELREKWEAADFSGAEEIVRLADVWRDDDVQPNGFERLSLDQAIDVHGECVARLVLDARALLAAYEEAMKTPRVTGAVIELRRALAAATVGDAVADAASLAAVDEALAKDLKPETPDQRGEG
jgi:hypothetical protein